MSKRTQFWLNHLAALKRDGLSAAAYARQHGISIKSLYYWQSKTHVTSPVNASLAGNFVAVRVADAPILRNDGGCTLVLTNGLRLEMAALPSAQWLVALTRTLQSVR